MTSPYASFVRSVTLTLLLLVAACDQSDVTAPVTPPDPSAAIVDGSTTGAFDEFLFLPPLVANPDLTGLEPFPGLDPVVDIDVSYDNGVTFTDFREFTSPAVVFDTDHYKVEWDTKESGFEVSPSTDPEPVTYRVFVRLGTLELGYLDIQFGSNGGEAKNLTTEDQIGLKDGRTVPVQFFLGTGLAECVTGLDCWLDVALSGQDNLFVTRDGDAALFIPDGALPPGEYQVLIRELFPCTLGFPADLPSGSTLPEYDSCYEYTLDPNPELLAEVTVAQCLDEASVPDWQESELQLGAEHPEPLPPGIEQFELLPNVAAPATLSCGDYVPGAPSTTTISLLEGLGKGLLEFVFGEPVYAEHIGFGGTSRALSKIKWVYPGIKVGGFDATRGGFVSVESGALAPAMQSLVDTYGFVWREAAATITPDLFSDDIDFAFLGTVESNTSAITALSSAEQSALAGYVDTGGCALLMPDNDTFGGGNDPVNESLIDAFGLDITGTLNGSQTATVVAAVTHPATSGIDTYQQNYPGWFDDIGQGTTLATNNGGPALVTIPAGVLNPGSGPVFAYSDANQFFGTSFAGRFGNASNRQLFLQSVSACGTEPDPPTLF